jgi:hypothetical protein
MLDAGHGGTSRGTPNTYTVTVSRINLSAYQDPHFALDAHTVTLTPDGCIAIQSETSGRSISPGLWDRMLVVVKKNEIART